MGLDIRQEDFDFRERRFEADIEAALLSRGGYLKGNPKNFDRDLALDKETLIQFIKTSQPNAWKRYETIYGPDSETAFLRTFEYEVKRLGLLRIFRRGFKDRGVPFKIIGWKPETDLNESTLRLYQSNILHCTRQLHYSVDNQNSIDIVLFINGIPIISMELKCNFTRQNVTNAIEQYKFDREPKDKIFAFKERVLVHFAVDLEKVYMTTKLEGRKTYFLPFNQGSNGAGKVGGAGNPICEDGYATAYLWEEVLCKDRLLEILHKYMHLEVKREEKSNTIKSERMIFPRYHQLDVVTKLLAHVKSYGAGHNYLIQHSAGSGKSNSIAWLAHRLSGLHNAENEKIFKSVIIVTDRRVLDKQLQDNVYQFDHVEGVVVNIDKNSKQLKDAIEAGCGIIITTLQKFPVIYNEVNSGKHNFAVIVDEAHSSQTGDAAKKLKQALANTEKILEEMAELEWEMENKQIDPEDRLVQELVSQGQHENLSFFAFTATPKAKTLNMFGERDSQGKYHPFHIYSMRQAIEEGFILDVLKNYMTYKMYYKIIKAIPDDPELDTLAGLRALRRFESLHPHNIAQKTAIMLEHFRQVTAHKINGKAKAMIVTPSRLHAVRYVHEFKRQIAEKGYRDLDVLVAFSGEIEDDGVSYTEEKINKYKTGEHIKEASLPEAFHTDEFGMLIVAEKYQTGFDEPLLHTMYVDKKLSGVKAVQTLSRLNRTMKGKLDTFVLDFVNSAEDIQKAFQPYYEESVLLEAVDPNAVYKQKHTLDEYRVYQESEVKKFGEIFFDTKAQTEGDLGRLQAQFRPAIDRYLALDKDTQATFRSALASFNRTYSFITQVCRLLDKETHVFSVYAKFLQIQLPIDGIEKIYLDDKVFLEYYRLEKKFDGGIELKPSQEGFKPVSGEAGKRKQRKDPLTVIIETINKKFKTEFTEEDKVLLQIANDFQGKVKWRNYATKNDFITFMKLFNKDFTKMVLERYEKNEAFFQKILADDEMLELIKSSLGSLIYKKIREDYQNGYTSAKKKSEMTLLDIPEVPLEELTLENVAENEPKY